MYGPPGTGKTLLARACAAQTDATFLKLAGPQLVQMFIGDGAKLVRDCFALAKEKAPAIIFIDELDAIGTKRFDSEKSGDREVQRTMLELLNQLDGFASDDRIKVIAATNRVDVLDPALLRSGRLDRKIEFPYPNEEARAQILKIHSRKMKVDENVNWGELARSTDEFGGAMLKAVCVEAGMIALRMGKNKIGHEHYVDAIAEVQSKKKDVSTPLPGTSVFGHITNVSFRRSTFMRNLVFGLALYSSGGWGWEMAMALDDGGRMVDLHVPRYHRRSGESRSLCNTIQQSDTGCDEPILCVFVIFLFLVVFVWLGFDSTGEFRFASFEATAALVRYDTAGSCRMSDGDLFQFVLDLGCSRYFVEAGHSGVLLLERKLLKIVNRPP